MLGVFTFGHASRGIKIYISKYLFIELSLLLQQLLLLLLILLRVAQYEHTRVSQSLTKIKHPINFFIPFRIRFPFANRSCALVIRFMI
jgi:hypothetical protein